MNIKYIPLRFLLIACIGFVLFFLSSKVSDFGILGIIGFTMMVYGSSSAYLRAKIKSDFWWYKLILTPLDEQGPLDGSDLFASVQVSYSQSQENTIDATTLLKKVEIYTSMLQRLGCLNVVTLNEDFTLICLTPKGKTLLSHIVTVI